MSLGEPIWFTPQPCGSVSAARVSTMVKATQSYLPNKRLWGQGSLTDGDPAGLPACACHPSCGGLNGYLWDVLISLCISQVLQKRAIK